MPSSIYLVNNDENDGNEYVLGLDFDSENKPYANNKLRYSNVVLSKVLWKLKKLKNYDIESKKRVDLF